MCPMMKVILQNYFEGILSSLSDGQRSSSSSLIFHSHSSKKNSTRNKKLSVRLSESITLFSFLSHLSDLFGPFFILSSFFSYSNRAATKFLFYFFFASHTSQSHILTQKEEEWSSKRRESKLWSWLYIVLWM